jgi:AraC-like DNA-binding protein
VQGVGRLYRQQRLPRPELRRHVACVWAAWGGRDEPLLPDAAVELVWSGRGLFVRGADTRPHRVGSFPDRTFVVVRFRPGAAARVLGLHGRELADARVGVSELWGFDEMERLESQLAAATSPAAVATLLEDIVATRVRELPDPAVEAAVVELGNGATQVHELATRLGLSERQLRRRCTEALGYGPKLLDRILRFQRFRSLARRRPDVGLAWLAAAAGYADQPHLTRECRRLSGASPAVLLARPAATVSFKTPHPATL